MYKNKSEIGTLATLIRDKNILSKKNFVKVKTEKPLKRKNFSRAINFFRNLNKKKKITIFTIIKVFMLLVLAL